MTKNPSHEQRRARGDILGAVLGHLVMTDLDVTSVSLGGPWLTHGLPEWSMIYVVRQGACWLATDGEQELIPLRTGDTVVLPHGKYHMLRDSNTTGRSSAREVSLFPQTADDVELTPVASLAQTPTRLLVARFHNPIGKASPLFAALPIRMLLTGLGGKLSDGLDEIAALLEREAAAQHLGRSKILENLVQVLFIQAMRSHLLHDSQKVASTGSALADPIIGKALGLIHGQPEASWTVASLAEAVGVSRSAFAARFADKAGMAPAQYLWQERMQRAAELLRNEALGIKEIATRVGYDSESAFSNAFKRWSGAAPGSFRRERRA